MALTQSIEQFAVDTPRTPSAQRNNVLPFPAARGVLPITLPALRTQTAGAQLATLLHSPLGVYVIATETVRDEIRVRLDIAVDDLDFTLHTLISTLASASIGPLARRHGASKAR
jgi:hypothetical protein